ncbi:hypothetical protein OAA60_00780 [Porticoccaceae bacterium]|nr:hypothetical protein [Porticoccaceae bacterium]
MTKEASERRLWGVTIRKSHGQFEVVDENGNVMHRVDTAEEGYKIISETDEAWEEQTDGN